MDPAITFYQALASISFTLLGLWFGVLQFAHGGWRTDPGRHRYSLHIALHFFLPGMASMASMLSAGTGEYIWRITFIGAGVAGLIEATSFLRAPDGPKTLSGRTLRAVDPLLYAATVGVAVVPREAIGGLIPLQLAGMATGSLFLVGLCYVWLAFTERRQEDAVLSGR